MLITFIIVIFCWVGCVALGIYSLYKQNKMLNKISDEERAEYFRRVIIEKAKRDLQ